MRSSGRPLRQCQRLLRYPVPQLSLLFGSKRMKCNEQAVRVWWWCTGEQSVREANAARFRQTCQREFEAFKKERLATGELECQKLITAAQAHLTQV